jgi:hypothetical protein
MYRRSRGRAALIAVGLLLPLELTGHAAGAASPRRALPTMAARIPSTGSSATPASRSHQADSARVQTASAPGAASIGDPYYPSVGNGGYDAQHYTLALTVDVRHNTL